MMARIQAPNFCGGCGLELSYGVHRAYCTKTSNPLGWSGRPAQRKRRTGFSLWLDSLGLRRRRPQTPMQRERMAPVGSSSSHRGLSPAPPTARQRAKGRRTSAPSTVRPGRVSFIGSVASLLIGASLAALLLAPSAAAWAGLVLAGLMIGWESR